MLLVPGAYCNGATAPPTYNENCYNYNEQSTCAPGSVYGRPMDCMGMEDKQKCFGGGSPHCKGISPSYVGGDTLAGGGIGITTYPFAGEIQAHQHTNTPTQVGSTRQLGSTHQHTYVTTEPESSSKTYLYVLGAVVVAVILLVMFFMLKSRKSNKNK
jgi:hypothetical protein